MPALHSIIAPVFAGMPTGHLKQELCQAFTAHKRYFNAIESGFETLTSGRQDPELLRYFFQSWSQTNNSAMTVSGIANRMTLLVHRHHAVTDESALLHALTSLHRIVDEDLAVSHKVLHAELFYRMASTIVGDDDWLSKRYVIPAAKEFKAWKDHNSLRDPDLFVALLTTLTHEIYTHGEVEFILPLFTRWLREDLAFSEQDCRRTLGWISVHCGPTERDHFFHAGRCHRPLLPGNECRCRNYPIDSIVGTYLEKKAAVMQQLRHRMLKDSTVEA